MLIKYLDRFVANDEAFKGLHLNMYEATNEAISVIAELLPTNTNIKVLDLHKNAIDDDGVAALCKGLMRNESVQYVDLSDNEITRVGVYHIAELLKVNKNIIKLKIGKNNLGSKGLAILSAVLQESSVTSLCVEGIMMHDLIGLKALAYVLNRTKLLSLNLSDNLISAEGAEILCNALKSNTTLRKIHLFNNRFREKGALCFVDVLEHNTSLYNFNIAHNGLTSEAFRHLDESVFHNSSILYAVYEEMSLTTWHSLSRKKADILEIIEALNSGNQMSCILMPLSQNKRMIEYFAKKESIMINDVQSGVSI